MARISGNRLLFPFIEGIHVLALSLSIGLVVITDLRLMGVVMRNRPASEIWSQFFPWMMSGFGVMFLTGSLLFWSHALSAYNSTAFRMKLVLLILSGLNAAIYHVTIYRKMDQWDTSPDSAVAGAAGGLDVLDPLGGSDHHGTHHGVHVLTSQGASCDGGFNLSFLRVVRTHLGL